MLGITSGGDFVAVKGLIEAILARLNPRAVLEVAELAPTPLLDPSRSCRLLVGGELLGFLGEVSSEGLRRFDLRGRTTVAELQFGRAR